MVSNCKPVYVIGGHSCDKDEASKASDVVDGHLDQVESPLQEVESTREMPVCEEVHSSYHTSCHGDASVNVAACNHEEDTSFSLLFDGTDVLMSNSSDDGDSSSSCDHGELPLVNLDAQQVLNVKNKGIVPTDDILTWDVESLPKEEPEIEMNDARAINVAKAKARVNGMKNERENAGSPTLIALNVSDVSAHVSRVSKEIAILHGKMLGALCVWPPMDRPRVMNAMGHNKPIQLPCLLGTGIDLRSDHVAHDAELHENCESLCALKRVNIGAVDMVKRSKEVESSLQEEKSIGKTPLLGEKSDPSCDAPSCSLVDVDATCEVSHEGATSNPPLVGSVSCSDRLCASVDDVMDEGMHLCGDMVLENCIKPMAGSDGPITGDKALKSFMLGFYDALGQVLVSFVAKVLVCTWLCSASMVICYGIHVAGNAFSDHGKENFEAKASIGIGSWDALLSSNTLCAAMVSDMCLQQSFENLDVFCETGTYDGHPSKCKQAYAEPMQGTGVPFHYVWDPGGCLRHVEEAEYFPFDPGGHIFVATKLLEMHFDPGGLACA